MAALIDCCRYLSHWLPAGTGIVLGRLLTSGWDWEPSVIIGCAALMVGYAFAMKPCLLNERIYFSAGVAILFLALVSPLDTLADNYLFSAHMIQHLLLVQVVAPLLVLGFPRSSLKKILRRPLARQSERILGRPLVAWSLGIGTFFAWHAPFLYNAALENEELHVVEHLSMLVTAVIFWWPIITPAVETRLSPMTTLLYLMPAGMLGTFLGIMLAYAPTILYSAYLHAADPLGMLSIIRQDWALSPKSDQQLGGMLMWVPGSFVYVGTIFFRLVSWFSSAGE